MGFKLFQWDEKLLNKVEASNRKSLLSASGKHFPTKMLQAIANLKLFQLEVPQYQGGCKASKQSLSFPLKKFEIIFRLEEQFTFADLSWKQFFFEFFVV